MWAAGSDFGEAAAAEDLILNVLSRRTMAGRSRRARSRRTPGGSTDCGSRSALQPARRSTGETILVPGARPEQAEVSADGHSEGTWQVWRDGEIVQPAIEVSAESGTLYFECQAGCYR